MNQHHPDHDDRALPFASPRQPVAHTGRCVRCATCPICGPSQGPQDGPYLATVGPDPVAWADTLADLLHTLEGLREPGLREDVACWRAQELVCVLPYDGPAVYLHGPHLAG